MPTLIDYINGFPLWFQMLFVSGVAAAVMVLLYFIIRSGLRLKTSKGEVGIGGDAEFPGKAPGAPPAPGAAVSVSGVKKSPHAGCPNAKDIVVILNRAMDILTQKLNIQNYEVIRQQMNVAEDRLSVAVLAAQSTYIDLLKSKGVTSVTTNDSFLFYRLVLSELKEYLLREFRCVFREHKIVEMSEGEYAEFVEKKVDVFIGKTTTFLNDTYKFQGTITREEVYDTNWERIAQYKTLVRETLYQARKIAQTGAVELAELDDELEGIIQNAVGECPC